MVRTNTFEYIIIGAGISGCCTAYELNKYTKSILIIDKNSDVGLGASGAAGAFLSPLLGKPNKFKDLVTKSLKYSTNFYKKQFPNLIDICGTTRIPKNTFDEEKFQSYIPFLDFKFLKDEKGYHFYDASVVNSYMLCSEMTKNIKKHLNYEVKSIKYIDGMWYIDDKYMTKNIILTTGSALNLIDEFYINIRPVWGQRIIIETSTSLKHNFHKECSVSRTIKKDDTTNILSIGATHHRFVNSKPIDANDTKYLLQKANDIIKLENVKVIGEIAGARASSVDYFPLVGELINSALTLKQFPYLRHGTNVNSNRLIKYQNLFILNGVGGRGFVLAPYLAMLLVDNIINNKKLLKNISVDSLFLREVKKLK